MSIQDIKQRQDAENTYFLGCVECGNCKAYLLCISGAHGSAMQLIECGETEANELFERIYQNALSPSHLYDVIADAQCIMG